ncbi:MAG: HNH endonuclease signature motif containing protein, partial [Dermatophilaceae bacterium]
GPAPGGVARTSRARVDWAEEDVVRVDHHTGEVVTFGELDPAGREAVSWVEVPDADDPAGGAQDAHSVDPCYAVMAPVDGGCAVSGAQIPGIGWVDAATVAALLKTVPVQVARAVVDADTGTLASLTTNAYTPPTAMREFVHTRDGTCRMWGCARRATHTDLDHTQPWPGGPTSPSNLASLCRRHHRMKQHGRWRYTLHPNGDITWISTTGTVRRTHPTHRLISESTPGSPPESRPEPTPREPTPRELLPGTPREPEPVAVATVPGSLPAAGSLPAPDSPPF